MSEAPCAEVGRGSGSSRLLDRDRNGGGRQVGRRCDLGQCTYSGSVPRCLLSGALGRGRLRALSQALRAEVEITHREVTLYVIDAEGTPAARAAQPPRSPAGGASRCIGIGVAHESPYL